MVNVDLSNYQSILILKLDGMGDIICTSPFIRGIRENFSGIINMVIKPEKMPTIEFCQYIDNVFLYDTNISLNYFHNYTYKHQIDLIISPRWIYSPKISTILNYVQHIPSIGFNNSGYSFDYSLDVDKHMNEIDKCMQLFKIFNIDYKDNKTEFFSHNNEIYTGIEKEYMIFSIASSEDKKKWRSSNYVNLCKLLVNKYKYLPILVGGSDVLNESYEIMYTYDNHMYNLVGRTDLQLTYQLMKNAKFIIGNDSGPMHIARTTGIPNITLFKYDSIHKSTFEPIDCTVGKAIYSPEMNNINSITPEMVYETIRNYEKN